MGNVLFCEWDVPSTLSISVKCHVAESRSVRPVDPLCPCRDHADLPTPRVCEKSV